MDHQKIGHYIATCRKKKGFTQQELADRLGITNKAVSKWETGQGMPDISVLIELSEILEVSVNSLLIGEEVEEHQEKQNKITKYQIIRHKIRNVNIEKRDVAGFILFFCGLLFLILQLWYLLRGRSYKVEYIADWMFWFVNAVILLFFYVGGVFVRKTNQYFAKRAGIMVFILFFALNLTAGIAWQPSQKEFLRVSDTGAVLVLKIDKESGKATLYRNRKLCFVRPADVLPYTVKGNIKLQWVENDACAITYESTEDSKLHQYVATYGDRGSGSFYYVTSFLQGNWMTEGKYVDYKLMIGESEEGDIELCTPMGKEIYIGTVHLDG